MANKLQLKHNKNEDFNIENYTNVILAKSEPLYDTVHKKLYIGDGKTVLSNLTAINVMSDLDAETIINLINNNDQNLKINADRVNISKTIGEETKDYKLSERFDNNGNAIRSVETLKIVDGENNNNFYTYSSLRAAIDAGGSGAGGIGPTGPTGPAGSTVSFTQTLTEGMLIGILTIDGTNYKIFAPTGNWEYPLQTDTKLTITQVKETTINNNILEVI